MKTPLKVLSLAAATGRVGYVFFVGGELIDWGVSRKASKSSANALRQLKRWIEVLDPDVAVTEKITGHSRKSQRTREIVAALACVAEKAALIDVRVERTQAFANKYDEAKALATQFPAIAAWLPNKRKLWMPEPPNTVYIEALSLAQSVIGTTPDNSA